MLLTKSETVMSNVQSYGVWPHARGKGFSPVHLAFPAGRPLVGGLDESEAERRWAIRVGGYWEKRGGGRHAPGHGLDIAAGPSEHRMAPRCRDFGRAVKPSSRPWCLRGSGGRDHPARPPPFGEEDGMTRADRRCRAPTGTGQSPARTCHHAEIEAFLAGPGDLGVIASTQQGPEPGPRARSDLRRPSPGPVPEGQPRPAVGQLVSGGPPYGHIAKKDSSVRPFHRAMLSRLRSWPGEILPTPEACPSLAWPPESPEELPRRWALHGRPAGAWLATLLQRRLV